MGMSASQARLLSITSRISDIEYKSQQISNVKIRLADESEKVANAYTKALNKQKITMTSYNTSGQAVKQDVTISSLSKPDSKYILKNSKNQTVVSSGVYNMYKALVETSNNPNSWGNRYESQGTKPCDNGDYFNAFMGAKFGNIVSLSNRVMEAAGKNLDWEDNYWEVVDELGGYGGGLGTWQAIVQYAKDHNVTVSGMPTMEEVNYYEFLFKEFTTNADTTVATSSNLGEHQYTRLETSNLNKFLDRNSSVNANDPNWLNEALESGEFMLVSVETGKEVSVSGETALCLETDTTGMAKAEAEYTAATAKINTKEKKLDNQLKALDTEHSALTTEFDSVKSLIGDNVEKSFNLFS